MSTMAYQIANLLEKMTSADKDYRFMATNDLMSELQKDSIKLDDDSERKVVKMLLKLLEDKNGEVQNLAVKCLGPLVTKVKETQLEYMVDTLCANMVGSNEQLRDVSSIALKTVISELPPSAQPITSNVTRRVTPRLTNAVAGDATQADVSVRLEVLDILSDVLLRYGGILTQFHTQMEDVLMPQLASQRQAVRKRAIVALSHLVAVCHKGLFSQIMEYLIAALRANKSLSTTRTYVAAIAAVSRSAAHGRFGQYLPEIVPILLEYCYNKEDDDELRECCLAAFEAFVYRCPKEISEFVHQIIELCSKFIAHDPNYQYEDDDMGADEPNGDMETDGASTDEEEDGDEEVDEYSDDDDMSWKVRRAAAKCLEAVVSSRREHLCWLYGNVGPLLISRLKEREEGVKADIFHAYVALLRQTKLVLPAAVTNRQEHMQTVDHPPSLTSQPSLSAEQSQICQLLQEQVPLLVRAVNIQLREKSLRTRQLCMSLLCELLRVLPGALSAQMHLIVPGLHKAINDRLSNSNMKIDALTFLDTALGTHNPQIFHPHVSVLVPLVTKSVSDSFYKVSAEALSVIHQLVLVLRPQNAPSCELDFTPYVTDIYAAVANKLRAADIDQEVKEKAISCTGLLVAVFGDFLSDKSGEYLPILLDRLRNEMTRLTTVKALATMASSPLKVDLKPILPESLQLLAEFLRKNQRALKISTLNLLDLLVRNYTNTMEPKLLKKVLVELPALINESDLQISQLALKLATDVLKFSPSVMGECLDPLLSVVVVLTQSPLLQGTTLNAALQFLSTLTTANNVPNKPTFQQLLTKLSEPVYGCKAGQSLHRQAYLSISKCVATVASCSSEAEAADLAEKLAKQLKSGLESKGSADGVQLFSLLALGQLARNCPQVFTLRPNIKPESLILEAFQSPSEEIKTAASYSLGGLAVGNLEKFLPFLLKQIETQPKRQYLLLHALKEVIGSESGDQRAMEIFKPRIGDIWNVLMAHASCREEGTRNVVAECLGKLCLMDPQRLLPKLKGQLGHADENVRATVVTAVKFMVVDQPTPVDDLLKQCIGEFLHTLTDPDLNVRRVALVTFNSAAHNKPKLVRDLLETLLPCLYVETVRREELIREVEMGPFKHTVDDGLDLRKAAFECMYTLLETCVERLDVFIFLNHVEDGLKDQHDIKLLTYLMLIRLSALCPSQVLQRLDKLVEPLKLTCVSKVKANSVKQEYEKQDELKRSALRAVLALQRMAESDKNPQLSDLLGLIKTTPELSALYQTVERDPSNRIFGHQTQHDLNAMEVDL